MRCFFPSGTNGGLFLCSGGQAFQPCRNLPEEDVRQGARPSIDDVVSSCACSTPAVYGYLYGYGKPIFNFHIIHMCMYSCLSWGAEREGRMQVDTSVKDTCVVPGDHQRALIAGACLVARGYSNRFRSTAPRVPRRTGCLAAGRRAT